jgi:MFS family permease
VIVVLAAGAMVATLPGRTHGLGMITERLLADPAFALTRVQYGELNLLATLAGALFCLPCGWLIDRYGLRLTLTGTLLALAATVICMTRLRDANQLGVAILLTRGFGQSALSVISITMVGKWFRGSLTMPMAIYSLVLSLGFAAAAQLAKPFAEADWRVFWSGLGWVVLAYALVAAVLTRQPPPRTASSESTGDSATASSETRCCAPDASAIGRIAAPDATLLEAVRTPGFWVFGLSISLVALIGSGISLFNESVLVQQGFAKETFYDLLTFTGLIGLAAKLPVGWAGKRVAPHHLLAVGLLLQAICMAALPWIHHLVGIYCYGFGMGVSGAITTVLFFSYWGQAYGQRHLGSIQATAQSLTVLASAVGPLVFAQIHSARGSYAVAFHALAGLSLVMAIWAILIPLPARVREPLQPAVS